MFNIKKLFSPRDMTSGAPWKRIMEFAGPMLLGNFAQQLYSATDSAIVGQYVGDNALAAVGSTMPIMFFLLALFIGVSTGAGILVSQYFGAKNRKMLSIAIGNCITLVAIVSAAAMVIGIVLARPLLTLLNTPPEIINWSADYLRIFFLGIIGFMFYNVLAGILRGLGDSFSALGFLLLATALNIGLDLWFVISFGWGVAGVALATILAQGISAALCYVKLIRMKAVFDINRETLRLDGKTVREIIRLGLPSGVTQAIFSMAMLLVQRLQNSFGPEFVATAVIIMRVDGFAMMPNFSFGQAMTTYIGQNVGAGKTERLHTGAVQGTVLSIAVATVLTLGILVSGRAIMGLFTQTQSIIDNGMTMLKILAAGYIAMAVIQSLSGVMRGAGDTMMPMWISIITAVILRVPLSYLLVELTKSAEFPLGRPESLYTAMLITWCIGAVINVLAYRFGKWQRFAQERMNSIRIEPSDTVR